MKYLPRLAATLREAGKEGREGRREGGNEGMREGGKEEIRKGGQSRR
jgi:hypothetical protein